MRIYSLVARPTDVLDGVISVVLVVLFSDSMHAVAPQFTSHEYKVLGLLM